MAVIVLAVPALVTMSSVEFVCAYATHLCHWPARTSCDRGAAIWWLVPIGLAVLLGLGTISLYAWVRTGRKVVLSFAIPLWLIGFPWVVLRSGPRTIEGADLWYLGG